MEIGQMTSKKAGSWTKVVIFVSLYVLLLESVIEWALVLYLYGNRLVDSKMAPSLILALVASFFTVPLVVLHSFLAWQHNKIEGFENQKALLCTACTYLLRLTTIVWLAGSVAGLVVVAQQASCSPDTGHGDFWRIGISCALHRAAVIVSILSFITVCLYFCSRELCASPYAVSLLGVYKEQAQQSDESIFSNSSLDSNTTLKNDILYLCRGPDVTYGTRGLYMSPATNFIPKSGTIEQPTPIHPWPQMKFGANPNHENSEVLSGTTVSSNCTLKQLSSAGSTNPDLMSISRTPTTATSSTDSHKRSQATPVAELPSESEPLARLGHKRQKSSVTSLRRFLPKIFAFSLPLSADPQIRALAESTPTRDVEKQADSVENARNLQDPGLSVPSGTEQPAQPKTTAHTAPVQTVPIRPDPTEPAPTEPAPVKAAPVQARGPQTPPRKTLARSDTMSSADAPEVARPAPLNVRRTNTSQTAPIPHTPHYTSRQDPKYTPPHNPPSIPPNPMTQHPVNRSLSYGGPSTGPGLAKRQSTRRSRRPQTQLYQFENPHIPRHTRSQYLPQAYYGRQLPFEPPRRISSLQRRNDVEVIYPSTRRPRSTTYGGLGSFSNLDCIRESGASVDEGPGDVFTDRGTYRGTTRTSMNGF